MIFHLIDKVTTSLGLRKWGMLLIITTLSSRGIAQTNTVPSSAITPHEFSPRNSQAPGEEPPSPQEMIAKMKMPPGFEARVFAAEPHVRQPVDVKVDDHGRVWVAECYSYGEWQRRGEDRLIVLIDRDGDGQADEQRVFQSGFHHLTSVELGFGGVWVLDLPHLLFIPDADCDLVPDGPPQIKLRGWTTEAKHNMANGLTWGPDGWLYGRHGITAPSFVLQPELPAEFRLPPQEEATPPKKNPPKKVSLREESIHYVPVSVNKKKKSSPGKPTQTSSDETNQLPGDDRIEVESGVWRYHPVTQTFEIVLRGMTNPWGLDWDEHGELFLSGNVNGHLWHGLAGALYERMFGTGTVPHAYARLTMIGEQPHYRGQAKDWAQEWIKVGRQTELADGGDDGGGGHSHAGLLIYQGEHFPAQYRGQFFMHNTHGRRLNQDRVEPHGSTFIGKRVGDFLRVDSPWYRGVNVNLMPNGTVLLADWCDHGECHDDDGVHRTSGRLYLISYGKVPATPTALPLTARTNEELVALVMSENEWLVRQSRRLLHERAQSAALSDQVIGSLRSFALAQEKTAAQRLRAWWTLVALQQTTEADRQALYVDEKPSLRSAAIRASAEVGVLSESESEKIVALSRRETSPIVLRHLISALRRLSPELRWPIVHEFILRPELASDHVLALTIWHIIEPMVAADPELALSNWEKITSPQLRRFIIRRVASEIERPESLTAIDKRLASVSTDAQLIEFLESLLLAWDGRKKIPALASWSQRGAEWMQSGEMALKNAALSLGRLWGDKTAIELLRRQILDQKNAPSERENALRSYDQALEHIDENWLTSLLQDQALRSATASIMARRKLEALPRWFFDHHQTLTTDTAHPIISALITRPSWAGLLLDRIAQKEIPRSWLATSQARLIQAHQLPELTKKLTTVWGRLADTHEPKEQAIQQMRERIESLLSQREPDLARGREVYLRTCAACHRLYDDGIPLAPELTGTGRADLDYLVRHVVHPQALVPEAYRLTLVTLKNGQVLSGVVPQQDDHTVTVQSAIDRRVLTRNEIASMQVQPDSWMPEGLFESLADDDLRDLVGYLRSSGPVSVEKKH